MVSAVQQLVENYAVTMRVYLDDCNNELECLCQEQCWQLVLVVVALLVLRQMYAQESFTTGMWYIHRN